jgi:penicillin-binding protein 2
VRQIEGNSLSAKYAERHYAAIDTALYAPVIDGMYMAVNSAPGSGATARIAQIPGIEVCGKTGTAQNPHGDNHSVFISFAPRHNPEIAVAVYLENAGWGAQWAAPIASLMIEKYLNREVKRNYLEDYVKAKDFINTTTQPGHEKK